VHRWAARAWGETTQIGQNRSLKPSVGLPNSGRRQIRLHVHAYNRLGLGLFETKTRGERWDDYTVGHPAHDIMMPLAALERAA
jgi:hypothetical protein